MTAKQIKENIVKNTLYPKDEKYLHLIDDEVSQRTEAECLFAILNKNWTLRMKCHRFIMIVSDITGEYINIYRNSFKNKNTIDIVADKLKPHKKYK